MRICVESDCDIVQIAALYGNTLFSRYVWPSKPILPKASEVHKITVDKEQLYVDRKRVEHVDQRRAMTEFVQFIQQVSAPVVLVAHNGRRFDFPRYVCLVNIRLTTTSIRVIDIVAFINCSL